MTAPDLSVIIVTWNSAREIEACLASLRGRSALSLEIIVVDNASDDDTVHLVRAGFPEVKLVANGRNVGFPAANNDGLRHAHGRHVLFLNPDTEVGSGTLERCVAELDENPDVGLVGCRMMFTDGAVQLEGARRDYRIRHILFEAFYLNELFRGNAIFAHQLMGDWDHRDSRDVEALVGAFMMARAEVADAVGGLPEELFMYHEDLAFCLRVRKAGWRIRYLADVETIHHGAASTSKSPSNLSLLEGEVRVRLVRERQGALAGAAARAAFGVRSLVRLAGAVAAGLLPGLERLREERPKAFAWRVHAFHLLWSVAPERARRRLPVAQENDVSVVLGGRGAPAA